MKHIWISLASILLLVLLTVYTVQTLPSSGNTIVGVDQLNKTHLQYENSRVTVPATPVSGLSGNSFTLRSWNSESQIMVTFSDETKIEGALSEGKPVTVSGTSLLASEGRVLAEQVHVHENYDLRLFVSILAVVLVAYLLWKQGVIKFLT
jgi:hypothetical protein